MSRSTGMCESDQARSVLPEDNPLSLRARNLRRRPFAPVCILNPHDIVLAQVVAALHLDDVHGLAS